MQVWRFPAIFVLVGAIACSGGGSGAAPPPGGSTGASGGGAGGPAPTLGRVALTDMGSGLYLGSLEGGLYPGASNTMPAPHLLAGEARARAVQPLDATGMPSASGKVVLLSMGMSNTTQEFCSSSSAPPCNAWSFTGQAAASAAVNRTTLEIVNGAMGGRAASSWDSPADPDYDRVRDTCLAPRGLSEAQVQVVWIKVANPGPTASLPSAQADAYRLVQQIGEIVRAVRVRYPNVKQAFLSSRIYAGYATTTLNPEPYAYESAFAVKWMIEAQIVQMASGGATVDPRAGDLDYDTAAPWIAWGPYLWADGLNARSDGVVWDRADVGGDGTHPAQSGEQKVGAMLLDFFSRESYTRCWFLTGGSCP